MTASDVCNLKADADLSPIETPGIITLSISARTASDEASEDFDIQALSPPADGIRLRLRVYLEGALE